MASDRDQIEEVVLSINRAWLNKDYATLGTYLAENVVLAAPASDHRLVGRDGYVQSYRDYDAAASTGEFETDTPRIDVVDDTAVALCAFRIVYELAGSTYREEGTDMLVLNKRGSEWRVVWRSMQTRPTE